MSDFRKEADHILYQDQGVPILKIYLNTENKLKEKMIKKILGRNYYYYFFVVNIMIFFFYLVVRISNDKLMI